MKKLLLTLSIAIFISPLQVKANQETTVNVPVNFQLPTPPQCNFPCNDQLELPAFAKDLNVRGPEGSLATDLSPRTFKLRLEDWRKHAETYRESAEAEFAEAEDFRKGQIQLLLKLAYYDELIAGYRNAFAMDAAGNISYGSKTE